MREIRTSGLMSGDGRRGDAKWLSYRAHPRLYLVADAPCFAPEVSGVLFATAPVLRSPEWDRGSQSDQFLYVRSRETLA
jgi:hypothetical protein